jgi:hypothetical protein
MSHVDYLELWLTAIIAPGSLLLLRNAAASVVKSESWETWVHFSLCQLSNPERYVSSLCLNFLIWKITLLIYITFEISPALTS